MLIWALIQVFKIVLKIFNVALSVVNCFFNLIIMLLTVNHGHACVNSISAGVDRCCVSPIRKIRKLSDPHQPPYITVSLCAPRVAVLLLGFEQCSHLLWPSAQHTDLFRHVEMLYIEISDVADLTWSLGSTSTSTWVWNRLFSCLQRSLWRGSRLSSKSKFVFLKEKKTILGKFYSQKRRHTCERLQFWRV